MKVKVAVLGFQALIRFCVCVCVCVRACVCACVVVYECVGVPP